MDFLTTFFRRLVWGCFSLGLTVVALIVLGLLYLEMRLPSIDTIRNVQMQIPLRIYSSDNQLIAMFGEKRRIPVTLDQVPKPLIQAILATEDQRFFDHPGVDMMGLMRAAIEVARTGTKSQGGSTITMQVARNFFLTRKKTYIRKLNEVLLALKIDRTLSKDKILELYLNKIYFGHRAYGVAAAAEVYFGKKLDELTLPEMAMLAGLPKAPSSLNPISNYPAALDRRNHVLERMMIENYIDKQTYDSAVRAPLVASYHQPISTLKAPYAAEMVRQMMVERFGDEAYTHGYQVYTTIDSHLQLTANQALRNALVNYDMRHGYRGVKINLIRQLKTKDLAVWDQYLSKLHNINGLRPAVVIDSSPETLTAMLSDKEKINIAWAGIKWTGYPSALSFKKGDVIRVALQTDGTWRLAQVPKAEGAIVALDPNDGAIKAISGGFYFAGSSFNRATQALRSPGSSFKPFLYSAALDKGYTLASVFNDAPIVIYDPAIPGYWRPQNDSHQFRGPTRLRVALAHSVNLVSIRLLQAIGVHYGARYAQRFGFSKEQVPKAISLALGTGTATPLQMADGYAVFANGGYKVAPYIINEIKDGNGKSILFAKPLLACDACEHRAPQVITSQNAFLMVSALQEVIKSGTGRAALQLNRKDIAGKTGTSEEQRDAWFIGFNGDLVVSTWVGFDQNRSTEEHGAQAALPMWIEFMSVALKGKPENTLAKPDGIDTIAIDPYTGAKVPANLPGAITEYVKEDDVDKMSLHSYITHAAPAGEENNGSDDGSSESEHLF